MRPCPTCGVLIGTVPHDLPGECLPHLRTRAEAAEAKLAEVERERDSARIAAEEGLRVAEKASKTLDTLEDRITLLEWYEKHAATALAALREKVRRLCEEWDHRGSDGIVQEPLRAALNALAREDK